MEYMVLRVEARGSEQAKDVVEAKDRDDKHTDLTHAHLLLCNQTTNIDRSLARTLIARCLGSPGGGRGNSV